MRAKGCAEQRTFSGIFGGQAFSADRFMLCDEVLAASSEVNGPLIGTPSRTRYQQASRPSSLSEAGTALPITDMICTLAMRTSINLWSYLKARPDQRKIIALDSGHRRDRQAAIECV